MDNISEVPKYIKKKNSDTSKANHKSDHKHNYEECLLRYYPPYIKKHEMNKYSISISLRSYCTICGKLGYVLKDGKYNLEIKELRRQKHNNHTYLSDEELYRLYHNKLPVFFVEDYWKDGYVNLEQDDK